MRPDENPPPEAPRNPMRFDEGNPHVATAIRMAQRYDLPTNVFLSLIQQESGFNPTARSRRGAIGLGQLMPDTAAELRVNPLDPEQNLEGSARYLRQMLDRFGTMELALAAYNAGPGRVRQAGNTIPNIRETRNYVPSVLRRAGASVPEGYAEGGEVMLGDEGIINIPEYLAERYDLRDYLRELARADLEKLPAFSAFVGYDRNRGTTILPYGVNARVNVPITPEGDMLDVGGSYQGVDVRGRNFRRNLNLLREAGAGYTMPDGGRLSLDYFDRMIGDMGEGGRPDELHQDVRSLSDAEIMGRPVPSRGLRLGYRREFAKGGLAELDHKYAEGGAAGDGNGNGDGNEGGGEESGGGESEGKSGVESMSVSDFGSTPQGVSNTDKTGFSEVAEEAPEQAPQFSMFSGAFPGLSAMGKIAQAAVRGEAPPELTEQEAFGLVNSAIGGPVGMVGAGLTSLASAIFGGPTGPAGEGLNTASGTNYFYPYVTLPNPADLNALDRKYAEGGRVGRVAGAIGRAVRGRREAEVVERALPPVENSRLTQVATTGGTYEKARDVLRDRGVDGPVIDYGAGRGHGTAILGGDSFEPYPGVGFRPTYTNPSDIPDDSYAGLVNLNVLNVLPPDVRDDVVRNIGRVLEPQGTAVITTRGRDVMSARGTPGPEPMSLVIGEGDRARYQKGFTPAELREYLQRVLGPRFDVENLDLGPAGALVRRLYGVAPVGAIGAGAALSDDEARNLEDLDRKYAEGGEVMSDEEYDRRLLSRMKAQTGRVTEPTRAEQMQALRTAGRDAAEGLADVLLPQSPLDFALMAAFGPGGRAARLAGSAALASLEPSEAEASRLRRLIRAYHGSPYLFDEFDIRKIGTGEGAQAYGRGLYFAENEDIAKHYRDTLSGKVNPYTWRALNPDDAWVHAARSMWKTHSPEEIETILRSAYRNPSISDEQLDIVMRAANPGHMYEVDLNAAPRDFLNWDEPLSRQSPEVRESLQRFGLRADPDAVRAYDDALLDSLYNDSPGSLRTLPPEPRDPTGADIYQRLLRMDPEEARVALMQAGIPGTRYLDAGSRGVGGTYNYAVFDPEIIDIRRRYAEGGLAQLDQKYAEGGIVGAEAAKYDPDAVDALVKQIEAEYV